MKDSRYQDPLFLTPLSPPFLLIGLSPFNSISSNPLLAFSDSSSISLSLTHSPPNYPSLPPRLSLNPSPSPHYLSSSSIHLPLLPSTHPLIRITPPLLAPRLPPLCVSFPPFLSLSPFLTLRPLSLPTLPTVPHLFLFSFLSHFTRRTFSDIALSGGRRICYALRIPAPCQTVAGIEGFATRDSRI